MGSINRIYIPLIIMFFIFGVVVGYVAHKPETIVKIETPVPTPTPTPTPIPTPTPTPTPTETPTPTPTPTISDFTVKNYDPFKDTPTYTIKLRNWRADPDTLTIRPGDTVLIEIADISLSSPMTLILNSYSKNLGISGAVVVTFNNKGRYGLKAIISSTDPTILPRTYAEGTITVY